MQCLSNLKEIPDRGLRSAYPLSRGVIFVSKAAQTPFFSGVTCNTVQINSDVGQLLTNQLRFLCCVVYSQVHIRFDAQLTCWRAPTIRDKFLSLLLVLSIENTRGMHLSPYYMFVQENINQFSLLDDLPQPGFEPWTFS